MQGCIRFTGQDESSNTFLVSWVHSGIEGNEIADKLAEMASDTKLNSTEAGIPV